MTVLEAISAGIGIVLAGYLLVPLFPLLYVIVRWRLGGRGDSGAGYLGALHYFRSLALLAGSVAVSLAVYGMLRTGSSEELMRAAGGVWLGGAICYGIVRHLLAGAPRGDFEGAVGRVFDGFLLVVSGLVGFGSLVALCVASLSKDPKRDDIVGPLSWAAVWLVAFLFRARRLAGAAGARAL